MNITTDTLPWYRQFWLWFVVILPFAMIVISVALYVIALKQPISMVKKDYYQEGLTINRDIDERKQARALDLHARVVLDNANHTIHIRLTGGKAFHAPVSLSLQFNHPVDDKKDLVLLLAQQGDEPIYVTAPIPEIQWQRLMAGEHHYLHLETLGGPQSWLLSGKTSGRKITSIELDARDE